MSIKSLTQMSLFLALIIVSSFFAIPLPFVALPIVLQNMAAMVTGGLLGSRRGFLVVFTFLFLVALGFPFLPGGRGGVGIFFSPSGGFLIGYALSAFCIGLAIEKTESRSLLRYFLIYFFLGGVLINFCGSFSLSFFGKMPYWDGVKTALVFIPVDGLKSFIGALVSKKVLASKVLVQ